MSTKVVTNRQPWKSTEPQPITLIASRSARRQPSRSEVYTSMPLAASQPLSFYSEVTSALNFVPGYQKSHSRSCDACATPVSSYDCYCGYCGCRL